MQLEDISVIDLVRLKEDIKKNKLHVVEEKTRLSHKLWIANNIGEQVLIYDVKLFEPIKLDIEGDINE